jgi:hypothetical protein
MLHCNNHPSSDDFCAIDGLKNLQPQFGLIATA